MRLPSISVILPEGIWNFNVKRELCADIAVIVNGILCFLQLNHKQSNYNENLRGKMLDSSVYLRTL